jgi:Leucine carboxyl methyltransferase
MVVNLAAGLDTRPYRMDLPSSRLWVEVDLPDLLDYKEEVLKSESPRCRLERVRLDLSNCDASRGLRRAWRQGEDSTDRHGGTDHLRLALITLASTTSPPALVDSAHQVCGLMESLMKRTEPSIRATLTPPG